MGTHDNPKNELATIAIGATFVAEPVEQSLAFWLPELGMTARIAFAPYDQVFQELLDPSSLFATNPTGFNVILARVEDWSRSAEEKAERSFDSSQIERSVRDLLRALTTASERSPTPHVIFLCPPSVAVAADQEQALFCEEMEELFASELAGVPGAYVVTSQELAALYPVTEYYDQHGDGLAHIPYTPTFFTALGTMIARKVAAITNPRPKVIVLDCDQTLWGGVCGEDGVLGVQIDPPRRKIQEMMVRQHDAGVLLCLCSKNNEEDVIDVFEQRAEMALKREHIVSWRINWHPKSQNVKSLAQELNLGLDSFVFLDDDPIECAEVQANCPEVLTFRLPRDPDAILRFLNHLWILDPIKVTAEAKERTELYKQNAQRDRSLKESLTFKEFLESLGLEVDISPLAPDCIARVAELTQRTNQFNLTTIRRSESEIQELCGPGGAECLMVRVEDRFGDYGLVGVIIFTVAAGGMSIDTFLLSCRALGRGVEHQMLAKLGEIALQRGLEHIEIPYHQTGKNRPALEFMNSVGNAFKEPSEGGCLFRFPAQSAAEVRYDPAAAEGAGTLSAGSPSLTSDPGVPSTDGRAKADLWSLIAEEMHDPKQIHEVISAQKRVQPISKAPFVPPRLPVEQELAAIYQEVLGVEQVGIHDNFFELGGHSLLAMQVLSRIREAFQIEIPVGVLFTSDFSVAEIAQAVGKSQVEQATPERLDTILNDLDQLSHEEVKVMLAASDLSDPEEKSE